MRLENDIKLDFKDVLLRPKRSTLRSRSQVSLDRTFTFRNSKKTWTGVPIIAANMDTVGTFEMAKALGKERLITAVHKHYTIDQWRAFAKSNPETLKYVAVSSGISEDDFKKLSGVLTAVTGVNFVCLDVANGYSQFFVDFIKRVRAAFPEHTIMAGNVVTGEMVEELVLSGADIVKVGIGPGSVCTTRKKTGVGYPQLSAVIECADAAHGLGGAIIADGGCTNPGDVVKAFGGGSDFVMLGGMFAGHDESEGKLVTVGGRKFKEFYGMSSHTAMTKHSGGVADYRASEGKHVHVPYKGPVIETIKDILGGLRSACTYVGASELKHLSKRTTFIRVTQQTNEVFAGVPQEEFKASSEAEATPATRSHGGKETAAEKKATAAATAEAEADEEDGDAKEQKVEKKAEGKKPKKEAKAKAGKAEAVPEADGTDDAAPVAAPAGKKQRGAAGGRRAAGGAAEEESGAATTPAASGKRKQAPK